MRMKLNTGYGYLKDSQGRILHKFELPKTEHDFPDEFDVVDVNSPEELDNIEIYQEEETNREKIEAMIREEMRHLLRVQAIKSLKRTGKIPEDYN